MKRYLVSLIFIGLIGAGYLFARGSSDRLSTPTFRDDGDNRDALTISVNTTTTVSPYRDIDFNDGHTDGQGQLRRHRVTSIINPDSSYDLCIGTWSGFTCGTAMWIVLSSSGTWTTFNHATFYMLMPPQASTTTIRGYIEKQ